MVRLTKLNPADFRFLESDDACFHIGEYTAGGGYQASDTNQQIFNLKKKPNLPAAEQRWKKKAIGYWAIKIAQSNLDWEACQQGVTFVPLPCSKPEGHELYDDRMLQVLYAVAKQHPGIDVRPLLRQTGERDPQHSGGRLTPEEIQAQIELDQAYLATPLKQIILVDDVITRGASYAAAKNIVQALPGVDGIFGLFLAKTIHPPNFDAVPEDDPDL